MAVEVRYLVVRDGKEVGMYTSKKEADAHDRMLDIAENMRLFIEKAEHLGLKEGQMEDLSIYFAQHREDVIKILKGIPPGQLSADAVTHEGKKAASEKEKAPKKEK